MRLAHDLPAAWNAPTADTRTKQRLIHILIQEIVCDLDETANEIVLLIHWTGGWHSELRVPRVKTGCGPTGPAPSAVEAIRKLASRWSDRDIAVSLNRMRCKTGDGETWRTVRVREMRERLDIPEGRPCRRRHDQPGQGGGAAQDLHRISETPRRLGRPAGDPTHAGRDLARSQRCPRHAQSPARGTRRNRPPPKEL